MLLGGAWLRMMVRSHQGSSSARLCVNGGWQTESEGSRVGSLCRSRRVFSRSRPDVRDLGVSKLGSVQHGSLLKDAA